MSEKAQKSELIFSAYDVRESCRINWPITISHLPACFIPLLFALSFFSLGRSERRLAQCGVAGFSYHSPSMTEFEGYGDSTEYVCTYEILKVEKESESDAEATCR